MFLSVRVAFCTRSRFSFVSSVKTEHPGLDPQVEAPAYVGYRLRQRSLVPEEPTCPESGGINVRPIFSGVSSEIILLSAFVFVRRIVAIPLCSKVYDFAANGHRELFLCPRALA